MFVSIKQRKQDFKEREAWKLGKFFNIRTMVQILRYLKPLQLNYTFKTATDTTFHGPLHTQHVPPKRPFIISTISQRTHISEMFNVWYLLLPMLLSHAKSYLFGHTNHWSTKPLGNPFESPCECKFNYATYHIL